MLSKTDLFKLQLAGCIILDISASGMCRNFWLANTYYVNDKYSGAYKTYVPKAGELQITSMGGSAHEKERDDWREHVRLVKDL